MRPRLRSKTRQDSTTTIARTWEDSREYITDYESTHLSFHTIVFEAQLGRVSAILHDSDICSLFSTN